MNNYKKYYKIIKKTLKFNLLLMRAKLVNNKMKK